MSRAKNACAVLLAYLKEKEGVKIFLQFKRNPGKTFLWVDIYLMMKTTITTILAILLLFITPSLAAAQSGDDNYDETVSALNDTESDALDRSLTTQATTPAPVPNEETVEIPYLNAGGQIVNEPCKPALTYLRPIGEEVAFRAYVNWYSSLNRNLKRRGNITWKHNLAGNVSKYNLFNGVNLLNQRNAQFAVALGGKDNLGAIRVDSLLGQRQKMLAEAKATYTAAYKKCLDTKAWQVAAIAITQAENVMDDAVDAAEAKHTTDATANENWYRGQNESAAKALSDTQVKADQAIKTVKNTYKRDLANAKRVRRNAIAVAQYFPHGSSVRAKVVRKAKRDYFKAVRKAKAKYRKDLKKTTVKNTADIAAAQSTVNALKAQFDTNVAGINKTYNDAVQAASTAYDTARAAAITKYNTDLTQTQGQATTRANSAYQGQEGMVAAGGRDAQAIDGRKNAIARLVKQFRTNAKSWKTLDQKLDQAKGEKAKKAIKEKLQEFKNVPLENLLTEVPAVTSRPDRPVTGTAPVYPPSKTPMPKPPVKPAPKKVEADKDSAKKNSEQKESGKKNSEKKDSEKKDSEKESTANTGGVDPDTL